MNGSVVNDVDRGFALTGKPWASITRFLEAGKTGRSRSRRGFGGKLPESRLFPGTV